MGREYTGNGGRTERLTDDPQWGDIYFADCGGEMGDRPVIVVQNNFGNHYSDRVIVVPITKRRKAHLPTHIYLKKGTAGLRFDSIATAENIINLEKLYLDRRLGTIIGTPYEKQLMNALRCAVGLNKPDHLR